MREVAFLQHNRAKWQQFEQLLHTEQADPDRLAALFVEVMDDLSYARTFYPGSKTTAYLNGLAISVHRLVYRNKKEDRSRLRTFWTHELPAVMAASRGELLLSFAVFMLAALLGAFSAAGDDTFVRLIMGDAYVNMTLENIRQGDPLAVYKGAGALDMFLGITLNNVRVAFTAFGLGLLPLLGTGYVLFKNGVMVGAFHYLFHAEGLLAPSLRGIYIHGALELPAIVIAGCAGLVLGNSLLFPGTYTRLRSFTVGARRGVKIVVGLVPVFITAGFLEGFVTRHTDMPLWLSLLIIGTSLAFIVGYFVVLPYVREAQAREERAVVAI